MTLYARQKKRHRYKRTDFWILWEEARVEWFERIALKHVYYRMWNRSPVQVQCMRQGAQGQCTGMTLRDGMGREVGGGVQDGEHMYTHGWFMSMYGKKQYCKVISLQLNKLIKTNKQKKRILEWVAISSSTGSSQPRDWTQVSPISGRFFTIWATREVLKHTLPYVK